MSTNRILTTTQDKLLPKLVDTVLNGNVFATRMLSSTKKWSGEQLKKTIKVSKNTTGGSFSGYDLLSTNATDNRVRLAFDPKFYHIDVSIPLTDMSVNAVNETKIIDLMAAEMESAAHDMADDIGTILYGTDTSNAKNFMGLGDIVDDGGVKSTYGGQLRATYTTLNAVDTASGGTVSLAKMSTLYNGCSSGSQKVTLGLCDETVFGLYEQLLQPQERITKDVAMMKGGLVGGTGFTGLYYKGFPILSDEKATAQYLQFVNEDYLDFFALPMAMTESVKYQTVTEGNDYGQPEGLGFSFSGWVKPANQAAIVGHIYLGGELVSFNPKRHGRLTGITGV